MAINSALIFAAGFGTRMGDLTKTKPKPLIQVANKPLIDYALDLVEQANILNTVVNVHYLPEQIEVHLKDHPNVQTLREEPNVLETGGGLRNALPMLGDAPVVTLNSDAVWTGGNPITKLMKSWDSDKMDALLMLIPIQAAQEHHGTGDFIMNDFGQLERRGDKPKAPFVFSGAQIIKTDLLAGIKETSFSLNLLWDKMMQENRVYGVVHAGGWVDVGRPEGIEVAKAALDQNV